MDALAPQFPIAVALAALAAVGYLFGRRQFAACERMVSEAARRDIKRALSIAKELESIAEQLRMAIASHHANVAQFKHRVAELGFQKRDSAWNDLCREAEEILKPTLRLASQLASAYDEIRTQSQQLVSFSEARTDPLTRLSNRRALDETLEMLFSMKQRYRQGFAIAIFDIAHFKELNDHLGHVQGDRLLQAVAELIESHVHDADIVARYGGEEFVVVIPDASLGAAAELADRMRVAVEERFEITISGGVAEALDRDTSQSLLSRADAALYSAKAAGRNRVFRHTGNEIESVCPSARR